MLLITQLEQFSHVYEFRISNKKINEKIVLKILYINGLKSLNTSEGNFLLPL